MSFIYYELDCHTKEMNEWDNFFLQTFVYKNFDLLFKQFPIKTNGPLLFLMLNAACFNEH